MEPCAARGRGNQESFPRKAEKKTGALRRGAAFVVVRADEFILTRTRPAKGLLGGMTEVPTTEWSRDFNESSALASVPLQAEWRRLPGAVAHTFTHFPLELTVYRADVAAAREPPPGTRWTPLANLAGEALPNVMRKVITHALGIDVLKPSRS